MVEKYEGEVLNALLDNLEMSNKKHPIYEKVIDYGIQELKKSAEKNDGSLTGYGIACVHNLVRSSFDEVAEGYFKRQVIFAKIAVRETIITPSGGISK